MEPNPYFHFHPCDWLDENQAPYAIHSKEPMVPPSRILPTDGLQFGDPEQAWNYQFEMTLEAESALRLFLALLVTYRQTRKLAHFLVGYADILEFTFWKNQKRFPRFRVRFDFSPYLSLEYSTKNCGCLVWLDGKQDMLHPIPPAAMDSLRKMMVDVWQTVKDTQTWEIVSQTETTYTVRRSPLS